MAKKPLKKPSGQRSSVTKDTRPQGSMAEKLREARSRGAPKLEQLPKRPASDVKKGDMRSRFAKGPPSKTARVAGTMARAAARVAGPVAALAAMTTPAGANSDKPKGPLMKGNRASGGMSYTPKTPTPKNKFRKDSPASWQTQKGAPSSGPGLGERLKGLTLGKTKPTGAPRKTGGMSYTPALPKAASGSTKVPTSGPKTRAPASKPSASTSAPRQATPPKNFQKGSTKPTFQPQGETQKRGAVASTKLTSFERAEVARAERDHGGRKLTRSQAVSAVVKRRKS